MSVDDPPADPVRAVDSPDALALDRPVLCIGNFDGVHLGHRMLLEHMRELADGAGVPSAVITFFPPAKVLFQGIPFLSSAEEKLRLLGAYRPDAVAVIPFTRIYAMTPKDRFLAQLARLDPTAIVVGRDFRFGHNREGGLDDLSQVSDRLEVFGMRRHHDQPIKSSWIRELLATGRLDEATTLLGHPYLAIGVVVEGERRGREIGFPTANLAFAGGKALPLGVFAVEVETPAGRYTGMANVGPRPTFPDGSPALEVHLFDFHGDLYGATLTVLFRAKLRSQRRFASLDELTAQLAADRDAALRALHELDDPTV